MWFCLVVDLYDMVWQFMTLVHCVCAIAVFVWMDLYKFGAK